MIYYLNGLIAFTVPSFLSKLLKDTVQLIYFYDLF